MNFSWKYLNKHHDQKQHSNISLPAKNSNETAVLSCTQQQHQQLQPYQGRNPCMERNLMMQSDSCEELGCHGNILVNKSSKHSASNDSQYAKLLPSSETQSLVPHDYLGQQHYHYQQLHHTTISQQLSLRPVTPIPYVQVSYKWTKESERNFLDTDLKTFQIINDKWTDHLFVHLCRTWSPSVVVAVILTTNWSKPMYKSRVTQPYPATLKRARVDIVFLAGLIWKRYLQTRRCCISNMSPLIPGAKSSGRTPSQTCWLASSRIITSPRLLKRTWAFRRLASMWTALSVTGSTTPVVRTRRTRLRGHRPCLSWTLDEKRANQI